MLPALSSDKPSLLRCNWARSPCLWNLKQPSDVKSRKLRTFWFHFDCFSSGRSSEGIHRKCMSKCSRCKPAAVVLPCLTFSAITLLQSYENKRHWIFKQKNTFLGKREKTSSIEAQKLRFQYHLQAVKHTVYLHFVTTLPHSIFS